MRPDSKFLAKGGISEGNHQLSLFRCQKRVPFLWFAQIFSRAQHTKTCELWLVWKLCGFMSVTSSPKQEVEWRGV